MELPKINYPWCITPKDKDHWIMTVPVISTGHLRAEEAQRMEDGEGGSGMRFVSADNGFILSLWTDEHDARNQAEQLDETFDWLNADTRTTLKVFARLGYTHLRFDPDGDVVEGLEVHHW